MRFINDVWWNGVLKLNLVIKIVGSFGIQGVDKKNLCRPSKSSQSR